MSREGVGRLGFRAGLVWMWCQASAWNSRPLSDCTVGGKHARGVDLSVSEAWRRMSRVFAAGTAESPSSRRLKSSAAQLGNGTLSNTNHFECSLISSHLDATFTCS